MPLILYSSIANFLVKKLFFCKIEQISSVFLLRKDGLNKKAASRRLSSLGLALSLKSILLGNLANYLARIAYR